MSRTLRPTSIRLRKQSRVLELEYDPGNTVELAWEFLRVYSPSAEVRGHSAEQAELQIGKRHVGIAELRPVGHYALQIVFDDGHDTGLYSWDYLHHLSEEREALWDTYLDKLRQAGASRDPDTQVLHFDP